MKKKPIPAKQVILAREVWLTRLVEEFRPDFKRLGKPLPDKIRCSVGFPFGARVVGNAATIGQCWMATTTADKKPQVFVSPTQADALTVGGIVVHELVHACGISGHGPDFRAIAMPLGLAGKMTATVAGPFLAMRLNEIVKKLGPYDHAIINPNKPGGPKKQGTRLLKVACPEDGYTVRITQKWIDEGLPSCPCGEEMVVEVEKKE